jgi:hydroxyacylglutathione hydrolase
VCGAHDVPAYIHPADRPLLTDPARGFDPLIGRQLLGGLTLSEPADVVALADGMTLTVAGLELTVDLAPGHTPGSVTFRAPGRAAEPVMFSGDLLFAGSIGRTDLPGGDWAQMQESLRRVVLPLDDATVVLPGHGPTTTIGWERHTNPFLAHLVPASAVKGR